MIKISDFQPAWWLPNSHLQTLWPVFMRIAPQVELQRERLELPDGDFLDLDWLEPQKQGPLVVILHGLGGSVESHYSKGIMRALAHSGWRCVLMHFRGCSGEVNRLPRSYHSGETGDIAYVVEQLQQREPQSPVAAIGFSLGGNVLLKWLGETGENNPLTAAVAISVPFELDKAADFIDNGVSRLYQWYLLRQLHVDVKTKFKTNDAPVNLDDIRNLNSFWTFDNVITAPLHGFRDAQEYYNHSSSRQYLKNINTPTLIIHAVDDPLMTPEIIPTENDISEHVDVELSDTGGHVGFVTGSVPGVAEYWLEQRIPDYFKLFLS